MKNGTDHLRPSSQTAQGQADAVFQPLEMGRALSGPGGVFHPAPDSFVGVQFRGVGGQAVDAQPPAVLPQCGAGLLRAVPVQPVPEQNDRAGYSAQQVADESDQRGAADRTPHPAQIGVRIGPHLGERRQLGPVEAVPQNGSAAAGRPSLAGRGQQREAALVHKDQRGLQVLRPCATRTSPPSTFWTWWNGWCRARRHPSLRSQPTPLPTPSRSSRLRSRRPMSTKSFSCKMFWRISGA